MPADAMIAADTNVPANSPVAIELAHRMREAREDLSRRWLVRIVDRVALTPNRVFPSDQLLDHVPLLLLAIADYLEDPASTVAAVAPVMAKAMELGALRFDQGFDEGEVLKEFEILGSVLLTFLSAVSDDVDERCTRAELLVAVQRVHHAVSLIHQAAVGQFLQLLKRQLAEREDRLRAFNRALTHEFRNRVGAAEGAAQLLDLPGLGDDEHRRLKGVLGRNLSGMRWVIENLVELSQLSGESGYHRHVRLPVATADAARLLNDAAEEQGVEVRIAPDLPDVEVNAAVELVLANMLGNAVKYSDPAKSTRWIEVRGRLVMGDGTRGAETIIEVADNGVGVPIEDRQRIFERFFRASATADTVEGSGIGLTIVQDVIASLGGRVWAEFPHAEGSVFAFSLPYHEASASPPYLEAEARSGPE